MPIRRITIDFTTQQPINCRMCGYIGEHNATELLIIPPAELTGDEVKSYTAAFETGGKIYHSRSFEPGEIIKIPLWQQLTAERLLCVQLEARGADGELIAKAPAVHGLTLLPSPQGAAAEADTDSADLASEVAANTAARHKHSNKAVLDNLAEDDKGRLTYDGEALVNAVISSLKKWDGGYY